MHFDWVNDNEGKKYRERNAETRDIIRRRATQAAALTKRRRRGQVERTKCDVSELQSWVVRDSPTHSPGSKPPRVRDALWVAPPSDNASLASRPRSTFLLRSPYSSSSALIIPQGLPELLQGQHFQYSVITMLKSRHPLPDDYLRYSKILSLTDAECLPIITSCYGQSACLDAAIDCLASRFEDLLRGVSEQASTTRLYTRALRRLYQSINTAAYRKRLQIYHSIPLLILYELLSPLDQVAYMNHARGAVHLLALMGPREMKTELNRSLLAAQSAMMVTENLKDGHDHFCATPEWHEALQQTIDAKSLAGSHRSEADVTLTIIATALPGLCNRVERLVMDSNKAVDLTLQQDISEIVTRLQGWKLAWKVVLRADEKDPVREGKKRFLFAMFFMHSAIVNRLAAATPASRKERMDSERAALEAANDALQTPTIANPHGFIYRTRVSLVTKLACSVADTSDDWKQEIQRATSGQPITQALFRAWCVLAGRDSESLRYHYDYT